MNEVWVPMRYMRGYSPMEGETHHRLDIVYCGERLTFSDKEEDWTRDSTFQDEFVLACLNQFMKRVPNPDPKGFYLLEPCSEFYTRYVKGCGKQFIWETGQ